MSCPVEKDMVRGPVHRVTRHMTLASTDRETPIDSETMPPLPLSSLSIDQSGSLASCPPRHGRRGKTRGINTDKLVERFGKLPVEVPMGYTESVGINVTLFVNELGRIIRDMTPLQAGNSWKDIDPSVRESIIQRARDKFDILGYDEEDRVRKAVNKKCVQRYTNWRCTLHRFYKKLVKNGKNPKDCPYSNVKKDDWIYLIDHVWNEERFTDRSQKCSPARSKLPYNHTCGSRSFANSLFIMEKNSNGQRPNFAEFYKKSHWSKTNNNWVSDECRINHEKFEELRSRCEQEEIFMTDEQMSVEVLGARENYIIGLPGVKTSSSTTATYAYESDLVKSLKEQIASLKSQNEAQNKKNEDFQAWVMSTFKSAGMVQVNMDGVNNENMDGSNIEGYNEEGPTNERSCGES